MRKANNSVFVASAACVASWLLNSVAACCVPISF